MELAIDVRDLRVGYGGAAVVDGLSLHVEPGEVVALLGANGAGKTTSLLTIGGFLRPMAGDVTVLGQPVRPGKGHEVARRGLAHVPEGRSVFFGLSVEDNLRLGRDYGARNTDPIENALVHFPELRALLSRRAGDLSGGEQQMVALGRALATKPSALIVDELSLGLAPLVVSRLVGALQEAARQSGLAVLLVEQHVHIALSVADRMYLLERGRLLAEGPALEFRDREDFLKASYLGRES